jgi:hypothetical protein
MKTILPSQYRAPKYPELKKLGYTQQFVSYKATNEIIAHLTSYAHPLAKEVNLYLSLNKNSLAHPVRASTALYAYGLDNINQFGGTLDSVLTQCSHRLISNILAKNIYHREHRRIIVPGKYILALNDIIYDVCRFDADMILRNLNATPYIPSPDSWYVKLCNK